LWVLRHSWYWFCFIKTSKGFISLTHCKNKNDYQSIIKALFEGNKIDKAKLQGEQIISDLAYYKLTNIKIILYAFSVAVISFLGINKIKGISDLLAAAVEITIFSIAYFIIRSKMKTKIRKANSARD
jgi:hypothetical protein